MQNADELHGGNDRFFIAVDDSKQYYPNHLLIKDTATCFPYPEAEIISSSHCLSFLHLLIKSLSVCLPWSQLEANLSLRSFIKETSFFLKLLCVDMLHGSSKQMCVAFPGGTSYYFE